MNKFNLNREQIRQLIDSWKNSINGSVEQKLIEDLFLITDTPAPFSPVQAEPSQPQADYLA